MDQEGEGESQKEEKKGGELPDPEMTTKDAVEYVESLFAQGEHDLVRNIQLI